MRLDPQRLPPAERLLWSLGVTAPDHIDMEGIAAAHDARVVVRSLDAVAKRVWWPAQIAL